MAKYTVTLVFAQVQPYVLTDEENPVTSTSVFANLVKNFTEPNLQCEPLNYEEVPCVVGLKPCSSTSNIQYDI
jgi:hypothetical protein